LRAHLGVLAALCAAFLILPTGGESATPRNGDWIAYSTAPATDQAFRPGPGHLTGSDVFLVRAGGKPRLVAGRRDGTVWNVCPAFSPDGTMLAFGTKSRRGRSVRVVGVTTTGELVAPRIELKVPGYGRGPCPRWSADGSRLAYLIGRRVVVRGLDGSSPHAARGDPVVADFSVGGDRIPSPAGDLVVRRSTIDPCWAVVARPDGSDRRVPKDLLCPYAVAGWSPDGRKVIVMQDVSGLHFTMSAVSVDAPFEVVPIVVRVRVNHPRSWPRRGDVSWQPRGRG